MLTSTRLQAATYLLCVCLFSISFLVFLNSSVSFVITDLIGIKDGVGDLVGTLGFADEIVALIACPLWGVLSDRVGVRTVCVLGYAIVGVALFLFVQARNVYPQLLLGRLFFSIGGAATSTMVTAILPAMTAPAPSSISSEPAPVNDPTPQPPASHSTSPSLSSEVTITPARLSRPADPHTTTPPAKAEGSSPSRLAGIVGMFTGCGALVALLVFLPLPARFSGISGVSSAQAVADSYYIVGAIALVVAFCCFFGLRNLRGEEGKGLRALLGKRSWYTQLDSNGHHGGGQTPTASPATYWSSMVGSVLLAFKDADIGLGYFGGFVARASSVGISLFIPLFVNAYFISSGLCDNDPANGTSGMKQECRRAYVLAAKLTGVSQLVALLAAPLFGYLSDRYRRFNIPLLSASLLGVLAYVAFAIIRSPETSAAEGGSPLIFVLVALIGINQIGAIVCSLGLIGRGVIGQRDATPSNSPSDGGSVPPPSRDSGTSSTSPTAGPEHHQHQPSEHSSLLPGQQSQHPTPTPLYPATSSSRTSLKGSIAGVYSLAGGAGILLLTKLGGYLFDTLSPGAPFFMLAIFNAALFVVGLGISVGGEMKRRRTSSEHKMGEEATVLATG